MQQSSSMNMVSRSRSQPPRKPELLSAVGGRVSNGSAIPPLALTCCLNGRVCAAGQPACPQVSRCICQAVRE